MRWSIKLTVSAWLVCLALASPAFATSIGVGTDTGRIKIDEPLRAGGSYPLPAFRVGNTGTDSMGYVLKSVRYGGGKRMPASWVTFEPDVAYLKAGEWTEVRAIVSIPGDAAPGHYTALLAAKPKLPTGTASVKVNIAAGPRLEIDVTAGSPQRVMWWGLRRWFAANMPWSVAGVTGAALALLGLVVWLIAGRASDSRQETGCEVAQEAG